MNQKKQWEPVKVAARILGEKLQQLEPFIKGILSTTLDDAEDGTPLGLSLELDTLTKNIQVAFNEYASLLVSEDRPQDAWACHQLVNNMLKQVGSGL